MANGDEEMAPPTNPDKLRMKVSEINGWMRKDDGVTLYRTNSTNSANVVAQIYDPDWGQVSWETLDGRRTKLYRFSMNSPEQITMIDEIIKRLTIGGDTPSSIKLDGGDLYLYNTALREAQSNSDVIDLSDILDDYY